MSAHSDSEQPAENSNQETTADPLTSSKSSRVPTQYTSANVIAQMVEEGIDISKPPRPIAVPEVSWSPAQLLPSVFVATNADTDIELPHITWNPHWRPALEAFADAVPDMGSLALVNYGRPLAQDVPEGADPDDVLLPYVKNYATGCSLHLAASCIKDAGLRREMLLFAAAFYEYQLSNYLQGEIITNGLIGQGPQLKYLFAFLRAAIVDFSGQRLAAHLNETDGTGATEGFPPHSDMWISAFLLNVFNFQPPDGEGASTLLPVDRAWDIIANSGIPEHGLRQMQRTLRDSGACDMYLQFNGWLYDEHRPWKDSLSKALVEASDVHLMLPGQGYLVNDRCWLHGRLKLDWEQTTSKEQRQHRLYRLGYNNRSMQAFAEQRHTDWAKLNHHAFDCVGEHTPEAHWHWDEGKLINPK